MHSRILRLENTKKLKENQLQRNLAAFAAGSVVVLILENVYRFRRLGLVFLQIGGNLNNVLGSEME